MTYAGLDRNSSDIKKKNVLPGVPVVVQQVKNPTSIHEDVGSIPDLAQGVKDTALLRTVVQHTLQTRLGSGIAVAMV